MTTLARHSAPDFAISGERLRVASNSAQTSGSELSNPYSQWAQRFNQDLNHIETRLFGWSRNLAALADEDYETPSRSTIEVAIAVVRGLKIAAMDRVAPPNSTLLNVKGASIGSGGEISIELAAENMAVVFRAELNGSVTRLLFTDNRLTDSQVHIQV